MCIVIILILLLLGLLTLILWLWLRLWVSPRGYIPVVESTGDPSNRMIGKSTSILRSTPYGMMVKGVVSPVDQHSCNACWAIATCQAVSDRLHLAGYIPGDELNYYAYHDIIIGKSPYVDGCATGTQLETGLDMFVTEGAPLMSQTQDRRFDDTSIQADTLVRMYKVKGWRQLSIQGTYGNVDRPATISNIKQELRTRGSIVGVINLFGSFNDFTGSGIYQPDPSEITDENMAHMISIVGYDDRDNTWILRNSYGTSYGYMGYIKIHQGDMRINLEEYVYAPDL